MKKYKENKERAQALAAMWQDISCNLARDYASCTWWSRAWYNIGKKYGLLRVFKENGIV